MQQFWQPYPPAPIEKSWIFGRYERQGKEFVLHRVVAGTEAKLNSYRSPIPTEVRVLALSADMQPLSSAFFGCLRTGDWVGFKAAVDGQWAEVILLAPCLLETDSKPFAISPVVFKFTEFRQDLREHFRKLGFSELATPTLVNCPGTEPFLDVFSTEFSTGTSADRPRRTYYLPTSPELHLKKALAMGADCVFELRPCFRNGEVSEKHSPEFWMLEWYRAFANLEDLKKDCQQLIKSLTGLEQLQFSEVSISELFAQLGFELKPDTSTETLKTWCRRLGLKIEGFELWDDLFYLIFVDRIESFLPSQQPLFVVDYPPSQAALARVNERGWADRFELYWRGFEIANAYFELNDPVEQRRRSLADLESRRQLGKSQLVLDEDFFLALQAGLPPAAGIALGVERLFMAANNIDDISQLSAFKGLGTEG